METTTSESENKFYFSDGVQAGLVMWLRRLAGDRGIAYLLREHEFFKNVYFPVAWSGCLLDRERACKNKNCEKHLQCYFMHSYWFEEELHTRISEPMKADLLTIFSRWRLEALYLARSIEPKDRVTEKPFIKNKDAKSKDYIIAVDNDFWQRQIYPFSCKDGSNFALVVGGPDGGPFGSPTYSDQEALKHLFGEVWPKISQPAYSKEKDKNLLIEQLISHFSDVLPSPPYYNGAIFGINLSQNSEPKYGLNPLAFNCYLAYMAQRFQEYKVPSPATINSIVDSLQKDDGLDVEINEATLHWLKLLAWFPQSAKMLTDTTRGKRNKLKVVISEKTSQTQLGFFDEYHLNVYEENRRVVLPGLLEKVLKTSKFDEDYKKKMLDDAKQRAPSKVLDILSKACDDLVGYWLVTHKRNDHKEKWIIWVRGNHFKHKPRKWHPFGKLSSEFKKFESFSNCIDIFHDIWDALFVPGCDLLNSIWAVRLTENDRAERVVPLFMDIPEANQKELCEKRLPKLSLAWTDALRFTSKRRTDDKVGYIIWPESVDIAKEAHNTSLIYQRAEVVLSAAERSDAILHTHALRFFDIYKTHDGGPHRDDNPLRHNWRSHKDGDSISIDQRKATRDFLEEHYHLDASALSEADCLLKWAYQGGSKYFQQVIRDNKILFSVVPMCFLMIFRLVQLDFEPKLVDYKTWLKEHFSGEDPLKGEVQIQKQALDETWVECLADFFWRVWSYENENKEGDSREGKRQLWPQKWHYSYYNKRGFRVRIILPDIPYAEFQKGTRSGSIGQTGLAFLQLLKSVNQKASEDMMFKLPDSPRPGMSFYAIQTESGIGTEIVVDVVSESKNNNKRRPN